MIVGFWIEIRVDSGNGGGENNPKQRIFQVEAVFSPGLLPFGITEQ
jgi:hypothetical protein